MYKVKLSQGKELEVNFSTSEHNSGTVGDSSFLLDIMEEKPGKFHILRDHRSYLAEIVSIDETGKKISISVNGEKMTLEVKDKFDALLSSLGMENLMASKVNDMKAPMPGLVLDIRVQEGQEISKGDPVLVLEAMKMENILKSPCDGKIKSVQVKKGLAVEKNQVLIRFE